MDKEEIFQLMRKNPAFYLATLDGDQPRVRSVFLYRADERGVIFHTGTFKNLYHQIQNNPKVEMCFYDSLNGIQVRVSGVLEQITDNEFKDEIYNHPTRAFLKPVREHGPLRDFYNDFIVYVLRNGTAVPWSMARNTLPKEFIKLGTHDVD